MLDKVQGIAPATGRSQGQIEYFVVSATFIFNKTRLIVSTSTVYNSEKFSPWLEQRFRQNERQSSPLLFGGQNLVFTQFLAVLAILHKDDLKKRTNSSVSSLHPGAINPFLHIVLVRNS